MKQAILCVCTEIGSETSNPLCVCTEIGSETSNHVCAH